MFQLGLRLRASPHQVAGVVQALRHIVISAQTERGFVASRIYQDVGDPRMICLEEDWSSETLLKLHIRSTCFTDLLMLIETLPEAPLVEVRSVPNIYGLEYIESVRFGDKQ
jgi:quinol monooxygenase YgiN